LNTSPDTPETNAAQTATPASPDQNLMLNSSMLGCD